MNNLEFDIKLSALINAPSNCPIRKLLTSSVEEYPDITSQLSLIDKVETVKIKDLHLEVNGVNSYLVNCKKFPECPSKDDCKLFGSNCLSMRYFFDTTKDNYVIYQSDCHN